MLPPPNPVQPPSKSWQWNGSEVIMGLGARLAVSGGVENLNTGLTTTNSCIRTALVVESLLMRKKFTFFLVALSLGVFALQAHAQGTGKIERLDHRLDAIVPADAKIEKVASGFKWTEGPIWIHAGYLLFAEIPSNRIMKWTPGGQASVFMEPSGYSGKEPFKGPEPGSNGMTRDSSGRLTIAGHARRDVFRLESFDKGGQVTILADRYQGRRLNSPNDLVYRSDGSLYFTDPPYGLPTQSDTDSAKELHFNGVYRIPKAASHPAGAPPDNSQLQLLIRTLTRPNGIAFSPDEKQLYVAVSDPDRKVWMRYDVHPAGTVSNGEVFFDATSSKEPGAPDGMKVDQQGNIYGAGPGGIWIISPQGRHLGTIKLPEIASNCNWGGADGKTLYITASSSVYRIRLKIPGVRP